MPGLFPGRVIEIHDPNAIVRNRVSQPIVRHMLERAMKELTGEKSAQAAWAKFVEPTTLLESRSTHRVRLPAAPLPRSCARLSPQFSLSAFPHVTSWSMTGIRYEMDIGSYQTLLPPGVRIVGIQDAFVDSSGYDPNVYCAANFFGEWETRSYMASIVAQVVTKIINVPTMKDHSASGVTGALKNLAYGTFNNVARSHRAPHSFTNPADRADVYRRTLTFEGGAAHHGRHAAGMAWRDR